MNGENTPSARRRDGMQSESADSPRRTGRGFIAICIGFAITLLLTVAIAIQIMLNTRAFE